MVNLKVIKSTCKLFLTSRIWNYSVLFRSIERWRWRVWSFKMNSKLKPSLNRDDEQHGEVDFKFVRK